MSQVVLQIFDQHGGFQFYHFQPGQVIVVGRDEAASDITLDSPGIAPRHLMLDCRQTPGYVIVLQALGQTTLNGTFLAPHVPAPLSHGAVIEVAQYELRVLVNAAVDRQPVAPVGPWPVPSIPPEAEIDPPVSPALPLEQIYRLPNQNPPEPARTLPPAQTLPPARLLPATQTHAMGSDYQDQYIFIEPERFPDDSRTLQVQPGEEVSFVVNVTNNGHRRADFVVEICDLAPGWCHLANQGLVSHLNPQQNGRMFITVAPPPHPTSRAGTYHFTVLVTSPHYPGSASQFTATLQVAAYYQFQVGELAPKIQTISWFKRQGVTQLTIVNKGNNHATFFLEGYDDERNCGYEFYNIPGEEVALAKQAMLRLPPQTNAPVQNETEMRHAIQLPVRITPHARPLLLRKRTHHFTLTITPTEGQQMPRALAGELKQKPLLGFFSLFLLTAFLAVLMAAGIILTFRPTIQTFTVNGGIDEVKIKNGETLTLNWQASPFARLRIKPDIGLLESASGELEVEVPDQSTVYELKAENFLSALLPFLADKMERRVRVIPVKPQIIAFAANTESIVSGEEIILDWQVQEAEELILTINGARQTIPTVDHLGQQIVSPNQPTTYGLEARNRYGSINANVMVIVATPTGTPVPTPKAEFFNALPQQIVAGEAVILNWSVLGADSVTINPIGPVPAGGQISHSPQESTVYTLLAVKEGAPSVSMVQEVQVIMPTATPGAPEIVEFKAGKEKLMVGGDTADKTVTLLWTVSGDVTDVQLSSNNIVMYTNLLPAAQLEVPVDENSNLFTLIAYNNDKSARRSLSLNLETPTPTVTPPPTATPTATPLPAPRIVFFRAENGPNTSANDVVQISNNRYQVKAGSNLNLSWSVLNAMQVSLLAGGQNLGNQPFDGGTNLTNLIQPQTYQLQATNSQNNSVSAFINVDIIANSADPPANFREVGLSAGGSRYEFNWSFPANKESSIVGFRIYRASNNSQNYVRITDPPLAPGVRTWTDPTGTTSCDRFYIVTLYLNLTTGNIEETDAGTPSYNGPGC